MEITRKIVAKFFLAAIFTSILSFGFNSAFTQIGTVLQGTFLEPALTGIILMIAGIIGFFAFELNNGVTLTDGPIALFVIAIIAILSGYWDIFLFDINIFTETTVVTSFASRILLLAYVFLGVAISEFTLDLF